MTELQEMTFYPNKPHVGNTPLLKPQPKKHYKCSLCGKHVDNLDTHKC